MASEQTNRRAYNTHTKRACFEGIRGRFGERPFMRQEGVRFERECVVISR